MKVHMLTRWCKYVQAPFCAILNTQGAILTLLILGFPFPFMNEHFMKSTTAGLEDDCSSDTGRNIVQVKNQYE